MSDATRVIGKVAIVTGGGGAIGAATARLLAERGATVIVADIVAERAAAVAAEIPSASALAFDLGEEASVRAMIDDVVSHHGRLDILINNAALLDPLVSQRDGNIEHMESALWDRVYAVNVRGTMIACREALPHLSEAHGCIVNLVSNLALQGHVIQAAYSSSKAAILQMSRSIAASHGRRGVRCNVVAPGMTMTPALEAAFPENIRRLVEDETLRDRLARPEEIAEAIAFLAADAARNITGEVLVCDGGLASHVPNFNGFRRLMEQGA